MNLLESVGKCHVEVRPHSHSSLSDICKWAGMKGSARLFNTLFSYQNLPPDTSFSKIFERRHDLEHQPLHDNMDLELKIYPSKDSLLFVLNSGLHISSVQSQSILAEFDFTIGQILQSFNDPNIKTDSLWQMSSEQTCQISKLSFGSTVDLPYKLIHHGFESQAAKHSDWTAIEFESQSLTYGQLDHCGNVLAAQLISQGITIGTRVAVLMHRCLEFTVSMLAILKAGATIVAIDSKLPIKRILFTLKDANVNTVLSTCSQDIHIANGVQTITIDLPSLLSAKTPLRSTLSVPAVSTSFPYIIIYTSGSTGTPKGVAISHCGVINIVALQASRFGALPKFRVAQFMAIGFDGCQWETWSALNNGSTLVLRKNDVFSTVSDLDSLFITPTGLAQLGSPQDYPRLKHVNIGGEACSQTLKDKWAPFVKLCNAYGPTEVSIMSHGYQLSIDEQISLGPVIQNTSCYILDSCQRSVPIGVVGEIYVGGIGVSSGYINLSEMTETRFIPDPFTPLSGDRMFKTGDLGRLHTNGNFEFIGRVDDQVKLKGYRIEIEEIIAAIMTHPCIVSAAVVVKDESHLVGFVTPSNVNVNELREMISTILPAYMIPAVFVGLVTIPTCANGKTDKKALKAMNIKATDGELQTDTEHKLASIWSKLLDVDISTIDRTTAFSAIGGDSISVISLHSCVKSSFNLPNLSLKSIVSNPVLFALATCIDCLVHPTAPLPILNTRSCPAIESTPIRIVCFHGRGSNAIHMQFQLSTIKAILGNNVEFIFIQGQHKTNAAVKWGNDPLEWFKWFTFIQPSISEKKSLAEYISKQLEQIGPVDALIGFSEGALVVEMLDRLSIKGKIKRSWNFSILCSGQPLLSMLCSFPFKLAHDDLALPCIYTHGSNENSVGISAKYCRDMKTTIKHFSKHDIPRDHQYAGRVANAIQEMASNYSLINDQQYPTIRLENKKSMVCRIRHGIRSISNHCNRIRYK
ncbi:hypothetical protein MT418_007283 [Batrachochytrium dendrobatidis]